MPELPEVETVVRSLQHAVVGRTIVGVRLKETDFIEDPEALERFLPGCRISRVTRRGKFVVLELERSVEAGARRFLLVHLGMTGRLVTCRPEEVVAPHTHVFLALDDGSELRYADVRRFGRIRLTTDSEMPEGLLRLGPEPLEITAAEFLRIFSGRRAMIKALLLNQKVLRGLGNIYTDEALWRARIHPRRLASNLKREELRRLRRALQGVLREAIRLRGSSVSDYVDAQGRRGEYQRCHRVYQREGKRCFRCGTFIRRIIVAGRSSHFCPRCQPTPRRSGLRRRVG